MRSRRFSAQANVKTTSSGGHIILTECGASVGREGQQQTVT